MKACKREAYRVGIAPTFFLADRMLGPGPAWRFLVWDADSSVSNPIVALEIDAHSKWAETCPRALAELRHQGLIR